MITEQHETEVARYLAMLNLKDARKGSRAVLGDGNEPDEWEDYNEIPNEAIARAMALHDDLVAALRAIVENADGTGCEDCAVVNAEYIAQAEAALAKARP